MPQRGGEQGDGDHRTITICNEKPSPGVFRYRLHRWVSRDGRCAGGRGPELSSPEARRSVDLRRLPRGWCPGPGSPHPRQDQRLPEGCDRPLRALLPGQPPGDAQFVSNHSKKERERSGEGYILNIDNCRSPGSPNCRPGRSFDHLFSSLFSCAKCSVASRNTFVDLRCDIFSTDPKEPKIPLQRITIFLA